MLNFKKFTSGLAAMAVAASAFMGISATADVQTTTTYNFDTSLPASPSTSRWSVNTTAKDPVDETNTAALYSAASNSGNGSGAYVYYDLSSLIPADVTSYTVSYKAYFPYTTDVRWSLGLADLSNFTFARYGYDATSVMIGSAGHFTDNYIRATSGGNRSFVSDWANGNHWVTVTDTVNVANGTWTASIAGDSTYNTNGTLAAGASYDKLLIYGYATNGNGSLGAVYLDDITITTTAPDPGAATAIEIDYTNSGTTVASTTIDISAAGKVSGETSDEFYLPAYVTDQNGDVYSTGLSSYKKTVDLIEGTTTLEIPVTAVAGLKSYFFEAENNGGGVDESTNADAYSMGKGRRRLDQKAVTITVPENGIYTVKTGLVCKSSGGTSVTITATSGQTSWNITDTYYNAYRGSEHSQNDVALTAGSTISFATSDWNTGVDYVLLTKTGEVAAVDYAKGANNTIATSYSTDSIAVTNSTDTITWKIDVPADGRSKLKLNLETTAFSGNVENAVNGHSTVIKAFSLGVKCSTPIITDGKVSIGLIVDGLYAPGSSAVIAAVSSAPTTYTEAGKYHAPDATGSEFNETAELWGVDYMLTMMYSDDELMEITGDIASDDEGSASDINDFIDMSDENIDSEAVGEME